MPDKQYVSISPEGHWRGSPGVESELVYLVLTDHGQEMLTPAEFAKRFGWKNDPGKVESGKEVSASRTPASLPGR